MEGSAGPIRFDPVSPRTGGRYLTVGLLVVTVALLGAVGGWVLRGWADPAGPEGALVGKASEFPPGSVTEVVLGVGHFDPIGPESPSVEVPTGREVLVTRLFVVSDADVGVVALSQRSPWLGCRIVEVTRAQAVEFGHGVPPAFDRGFLDPCHGGLFSLDGQHLAGPGHRGLSRFPVSYLPDGSVIIDLTGLQPTPPSP